MKKIKTKCGYIAYEATAQEAASLGGYGICDSCNAAALNGYLVPVTGYYLCKDCYDDFNERAVFYLEDIPYETEKSKYFESKIPLENTKNKGD